MIRHQNTLAMRPTSVLMRGICPPEHLPFWIFSGGECLSAHWLGPWQRLCQNHGQNQEVNLLCEVATWSIILRSGHTIAPSGQI